MEHQYSILHLKTSHGKATIGILEKGVVGCLMMPYRDSGSGPSTETHKDTQRHTDRQKPTPTHTCPLPTVGRKEVLIKAVTVS